MYLSDGELKKAIDDKTLVFHPPPDVIDPTSIDLHLGSIAEAKVWDIEKYTAHQNDAGNSRPELRIGQYNLARFSSRYLTTPPDFDESRSGPLVSKRINQVIVRPGGFVLWQTKEKVGTPQEGAKLICFVDGKSTRARAGILVHLTAPTIHSAWAGVIVLEIANVGPFDIVLQENDVIAQLTVAQITSPPLKTLGNTSVTAGQKSVDGTH